MSNKFDDEEDDGCSLSYAEVDGEYGKVLIVVCEHCRPLVEKTLNELMKEKLH